MGQWFDLTGDARLGACATEGCGGQPTKRLEAGGVGSNYCSGCAAKIKALSAVPLPDELEVVARLRYEAGLVRAERNGFKEVTPRSRTMDEAADALSQAHSTIAALRAEIEQLTWQLDASQTTALMLNGVIDRCRKDASSAEAEVKRLTEEKEALRRRLDLHEAALSFVRRWAVQKEGNGTSAEERLSAIAHHPGIQPPSGGKE